MPDPKSLLDRLADFLSPQPTSPSERRQELIETLREAQAEGLIDADALSMIEGVFQVGQLCARDILVPRAQIDWIDINLPLADLMKNAIEAAHSRFPVFEGSRDNVIGILLAKDLLRHATEKDFQIRDWLRPAVFIPESKRLSVLLRDFKDNRNHLAIVVDEYGGTAGLITIEDILEEIVGEIADEYDEEEDIQDLEWLSETKARSSARMHLEDLADALEIEITEDEKSDVDTVGGLVAKVLGRVPIPGSAITLHGWVITAERPIGRRHRIATFVIERSNVVEDANLG